MASKQLKFFNSKIIFWETRTLSRLIIAIKSTACFRKKITVLIKCRVINAARSESWDVAQRELKSPRGGGVTSAPQDSIIGRGDVGRGLDPVFDLIYGHYQCHCHYQSLCCGHNYWHFLKSLSWPSSG